MDLHPYNPERHDTTRHDMGQIEKNYSILALTPGVKPNFNFCTNTNA
jgi:hypothetical protein